MFLGANELSQNGSSKILQILEEKVWQNRKRSNQFILRKIEEAYDAVQNIEKYSQSIEKKDFVLLLDPMFTESDENGDCYSSKSRFDEYVKKELLTHKTYEFFCPVTKIENFPFGTEIGYFDTMRFDELPADTKDFFIQRWQHYFDYKPERRYTDNDSLIKDRQEYLFFKLELRAINSIVAEDWIGDLLEASLHILRFLYDKGLGTLEPIYKGPDGKYFVSDGLIEGFHPAISEYSDRNDINILTEICVNNTSRTEIEERIWSAVIAYSISTTVNYYGVTLTLLSSALEILLLNEQQDNLSYKLGERVAFLVGSKKNRLHIFEEIVVLYRKRSKVIHGGEHDITEHDVQQLSKYVKSVINRLIILRSKGFKYVVPRQNQKSVLQLITSLKFGMTTQAK